MNILNTLSIFCTILIKEDQNGFYSVAPDTKTNLFRLILRILFIIFLSVTSISMIVSLFKKNDKRTFFIKFVILIVVFFLLYKLEKLGVYIPNLPIYW